MKSTLLYISFFFLSISIAKSIEVDTVWNVKQPYYTQVAGTYSDTSKVLLWSSYLLVSANPESGEIIQDTYTELKYFFNFAFVSDSIVYLVSKQNIIFKYNYDVGEVLDSLRISESIYEGNVNIDLSPDETKLYIAQDNHLSVVDLNSFELIAQDFVFGIYMVLATNKPDEVIIACDVEDDGHILSFGKIKNDSTISKGKYLDINDDSYSDLDLLNNENAFYYCDGDGEIWKLNLDTENETLMLETELDIGLEIQLFKDDVSILTRFGHYRNLKTNESASLTQLNRGFIIPNTYSIIHHLQTQPEKVNYTRKIKLDFTTSIEPQYHSKPLIYPQPSSGVFNITLDESYLNKEYSIYNTAGNVVSKGIINNIDSGSFQLNTPDLPKGVYYFVVGDLRCKIVRGEK